MNPMTSFSAASWQKAMYYGNGKASSHRCLLPCIQLTGLGISVSLQRQVWMSTSKGIYCTLQMTSQLNVGLGAKLRSSCITHCIDLPVVAIPLHYCVACVEQYCLSDRWPTSNAYRNHSLQTRPTLLSVDLCKE